MTPKEIVLGGYEAFAEGNMEKLGAIYHPECRININGKHALSGEYENFFLNLNSYNYLNFKKKLN